MSVTPVLPAGRLSTVVPANSWYRTRAWKVPQLYAACGFTGTAAGLLSL